MNRSKILSTLSSRHLSRWISLSIIAAGMLVLPACAVAGTMDTQPRYLPLEASTLFSDGRSARPVEAGTIPYLPRNEDPNSLALTGLDQNGQPVQDFPVTVDQSLVQLGQERFNIFCKPCHGPTGAGDGKVIPFGFSKPPDLLGADAKTLANGEIFQIIENGKGKMFSYGYRVKPPERWAIIAYLRAMQLKNGAVNPQDLTSADLQQIGKQP